MSDNDSDYPQEEARLSALLLDNDPAAGFAHKQASARQAALRTELLVRCAPAAAAPPRRSRVWIWSGATVITAMLALVVWIGASHRHTPMMAIPVQATPVAVTPRPAKPTVAIEPVAPQWEARSHETAVHKQRAVSLSLVAAHRRRHGIHPMRPVEVGTAARRRSPREFASVAPLRPAKAQQLVVIVNNDTAVATPEPAPICIVTIGSEESSAPKGSSLTVVTKKENN